MKHLFFIFVSAIFANASLFAQKEAVTLPDWQVQPQALKNINSPFRDVNISITPNGKKLYFMSGRGGMKWSQVSLMYKGKPEYDGDLWYSEKTGDTWGNPKCVGRPVCTSQGEDEPNISADGQTVYFQSWNSAWRMSEGPYYRAELHGDTWSKPEGMGGGIAQFFRDTQFATDGMSVSPDGNTFVVACGAAYDGKMDIYISHKDENKRWSFPQKLHISTPEDDRSVFIGADNKTLYFGSAGWGGFGKLDIFKTTIENGDSCGTVYNIGKPFNTPAEDYGFVMDGVRNDVYFVRNNDIFYAHLGETIDERIKSDPVIVMDGMVKDASANPVEAEITMLDANKKIIAQARSNALTGDYSLSFPKKEGIYTQKIQYNDGRVVEETFIINEKTPNFVEKSIVAEAPQKEEPVITDRVMVELNPAPKAVETPAPTVVETKTVTVIAERMLEKTIYFDFDRDNLTPISIHTLKELVAEIKDIPHTTIQITGHTDALGADQYNQRLSEKRTHKVATFLNKYGLQTNEKLIAKGETEPREPNDSKSNRAKNRRVEVMVRY
jgi:outer membrane protein OmpA-like peptidoglycan-associated protein